VTAATTTAPDHRWRSLQAAAKYAGVDERSMRRYIATGQLTGYRMGERLIRVDLNELDAMMRPIPTTGPRDDAG
jgi:excisionase family DNA binding protein